MDEKTRREVCRMVAGLVAIDLDVDEGERRFVDSLLTKFGIPESEWDAILPLMEPEDAHRCLQGLDPSAQQEAFDLLLQAAAVDDHITLEEREYLEAVCDAINVSKEELSVRLDRLMHP